MNWELLAVGFAGGIAWTHLVYKVRKLGDKVRDLTAEVRDLKENDMRHLQGAIDALPCLADYECPEDSAG